MEDVKSIFDRAAGEYDGLRRKLIPCFDEFYGTVLSIIPFKKEDNFSVLDLGAGTGLLTSFITGAFPNSRVTLMDVSPGMLAKAKERFASAGDKISYSNTDFNKDPLPGRFDIIVSALAIHHTPENELQKVFGKAYDALEKEGMFINADQTLGSSRRIENIYQDNWLKSIRKNGCTEDDVNAAVERMKADRTATLRTQLDLMEAAGFREVECWFKNYRFAVYSGIR